MTHLEFPVYLDHLTAESRRFRDVMADCDPEAVVPSCPDWRADDLLWHLGQVQHWWTFMVAQRPKGPDDYTEPERPGDHDGLLGFYDEGYASLVDALSSADPSEYCSTWHPEHKDVAFVYRRQALEALIHRRDAELAADAVTPFPADLAADGVDEVLDVMYGGLPPWGSFSPLPHHLRLDLTDTGDAVWVQLGRFHGTDPDGVDHEEDDIHVVSDPGTDPDAVISGTAEQLCARLWRRADGSDIHLAGDLSMVDRFREIISQPIN